MKFLVCDDDPVIRYLLQVVITKRGHEVVAVEHPDGVAPAVIEHAPDMILLDYMMPDRTGADVVEELRADPQTAATPVAYLTGRADVGDGTTLEEMGVVGVIEKPFDTSTLIPRLLSMLGT